MILTVIIFKAGMINILSDHMYVWELAHIRRKITSTNNSFNVFMGMLILFEHPVSVCVWLTAAGSLPV